MYLLDTDICSYILRARPESVLKKFRQARPENLAVSVITQAELFYGVVRSAAVKINLEIVQDFLSRLQVLDWSGAAAMEYGRLRAALEKTGTPIGNMDLMIAAHALSLPATVVTNNVRHFERVPKLKVVNWVE
jgi:tRNA(fMet)-specific endonuclease VapC